MFTTMLLAFFVGETAHAQDLAITNLSAEATSNKALLTFDLHNYGSNASSGGTAQVFVDPWHAPRVGDVGDYTVKLPTLKGHQSSSFQTSLAFDGEQDIYVLLDVGKGADLVTSNNQYRFTVDEDCWRSFSPAVCVSADAHSWAYVDALEGRGIQADPWERRAMRLHFEELTYTRVGVSIAQHDLNPDLTAPGLIKAIELLDEDEIIERYEKADFLGLANALAEKPESVLDRAIDDKSDHDPYPNDPTGGSASSRLHDAQNRMDSFMDRSDPIGRWVGETPDSIQDDGKAAVGPAVVLLWIGAQIARETGRKALGRVIGAAAVALWSTEADGEYVPDGGGGAEGDGGEPDGAGGQGGEPTCDDDPSQEKCNDPETRCIDRDSCGNEGLSPEALARLFHTFEKTYRGKKYWHPAIQYGPDDVPNPQELSLDELAHEARNAAYDPIINWGPNGAPEYGTRSADYVIEAWWVCPEDLD
jgi:hypothetical protein